MNEDCARCAPPKRAAFIIAKGNSVLAWCVGCAQEYFPGYHAQGWEITPLSNISAAPQLDQLAS